MVLLSFISIMKRLNYIYICPKDINRFMKRKKKDPTQSYDKNPFTQKKIQKATRQHKHATKTSITQRLRTD